jgi:ribosomal protein S27E
MRLKDKLIRRNCPVCEEEITLGTSALNKKINCPKCRQTVIIPDGGEASAAPVPQKTTLKKAAPKEKRRVRPIPVREAVAREATVREIPPTVPEPRISIECFRAVEAAPFSQPPVPQDPELTEPMEPMEAIAPESRKHDVVYCLCHGQLTKRRDSAVCSFAPATCCIYANQPGS